MRLLEPSYDVVERVVTFRLPAGDALEPGLLYQLEIGTPTPSEASGFRAFDGAPLEAADVALDLSFLTAREAPAPETAVALATCAEAMAVLDGGGCAGCHSSAADAPLGLHLDTARALRETAVGRVARETDVGPVAGRPLVAPPRFGVGMPRIDPGNPGTSYLLYKLLRNPGSFRDCTSLHRAAMPVRGCAGPSPAELDRLRDWSVPLDPMPPGSASLPGGLADLQLLQSFILGGADTSACP